MKPLELYLELRGVLGRIRAIRSASNPAETDRLIREAEGATKELCAKLVDDSATFLRILASHAINDTSPIFPEPINQPQQ